MKLGDMVIPRKDVLDGCGCLWELFLAEKGWNVLLPGDKPGVISCIYPNGMYDVFFPALNYTVDTAFPDEFRRVL